MFRKLIKVLYSPMGLILLVTAVALILPIVASRTMWSKIEDFDNYYASHPQESYENSMGAEIFLDKAAAPDYIESEQFYVPYAVGGVGAMPRLVDLDSECKTVVSTQALSKVYAATWYEDVGSIEIYRPPYAPNTVLVCIKDGHKAEVLIWGVLEK